jgi:hypothetical protein
MERLENSKLPITIIIIFIIEISQQVFFTRHSSLGCRLITQFRRVEIILYIKLRFIFSFVAHSSLLKIRKTLLKLKFILIKGYWTYEKII